MTKTIYEKKKENEEQKALEERLKTEKENAEKVKQKLSVSGYKPTFAENMISNLTSRFNTIFHKTFVRVIGEGYEEQFIAVEGNELGMGNHFLKCNAGIFIRVTNPQILKNGNRIYYVREGENHTTSYIDINRDRFIGASELKNTEGIIPKMFDRARDYGMIEQLHKTRSMKNAATVMIIMLAIGAGIGIGMMIDQSFFNDDSGEEIKITGDYNEQKIVNYDTNTNNDNDGTVVIQ